MCLYMDRRRRNIYCMAMVRSTLLYLPRVRLRASSTPADHEFFRADDFTGTCRNETKQQRRPKFPGKTSPVPTRARRMQHTTYGDFADIWPGPELHMHPINYKLRRILLLLIRGF
ncbi:hypothetical protein BS78_07G048100 [Paspalum vaginatum]|nr:hypothetical protein BS78_07G048100 [Paspalum vaginatum]